MNRQDSADSYWLSVIARSLAYRCLQDAQIRDKKLADKAAFLSGLGLSLKDTAAMLDSSEASLRELARLARKSKGKRNAKRK